MLFVGFIDGWSYDEKCLARMSSITGRVLSVDRIKHYKTPEDLKAAILDNTVRNPINRDTTQSLGVSNTCV